MPEVYPSYELQVTVDGGSLQCIEGVNLVESTLVQDSIGADTGWRSYRANLQDFVLSLNGVDQGAYAILRALKRSRASFAFELRTSDNNIITSGNGVISALERGHVPNDSGDGWRCQITGQDALTTV